MSTEPEAVAEKELYELFRPHRPDAEAFRRGVERRLAEQRAAEDARMNEKDSPAQLLWRRVAGLWPGDPLAGALGGSALGKVVGVKLLPAVLALPALLLGSAFGAFAAAARSLRRSADQAVPGERSPSPWRGYPNRDVRVGSRLLSAVKVGAILLVASPIFGGAWAIDGLFLVLLVSMAGLVISVRGLALAGLLLRPDVARLCERVLGSVFVGFLWTALRNPYSVSELGTGWSVAVMLSGSVLCMACSRPTSLRMIGGLLLLPVLVAVYAGGYTRASPATIRKQLAGIALAPANRSSWSEAWSKAKALHRALDDCGHESADLSALRHELETQLEAGDAYPWEMWDTALQMGLLDREHRMRLANSVFVWPELVRLRDGTGAPPLRDGDEYLYVLLRDEVGLRPAERAHLATRLEAAWPTAQQYGALEDALLCIRGLDALGYPERVDTLRAKAHDLLVSHWVGAAGFHPGGFTSDPVKFRSSFDNQTWFAVQLMVRLGVPAEIDLRLLRGYLRNESRAGFFDRLPDKAYSRAALLVFEEKIGLPPRSPLQRVLDERLLILSILIVALCLLAIRLAPPPEPTEGNGALP